MKIGAWPGDVKTVHLYTTLCFTMSRSQRDEQTAAIGRGENGYIWLISYLRADFQVPGPSQGENAVA